RSSDHFTQNGAGAHQLYTLLGFLRTFLQQVQTFQDVFFLTWLQAWLRIVLVHHGDVVEHVLLIGNHTAQAVLHDDRDFVCEGRIVRHAVRNGGCHDVAVTIFVLQAFTVQRGTTGGATQQEATCTHVARSPGQITDTLQTEHRVEGVERHHHAVVGRVRSRSSDPRCHGARLVNTFLQNLTSLVFTVVADLILVDRLIELTIRVVDTDLTEQTFHTEGTRFINQNRHHTLAEIGITQQD